MFLAFLILSKRSFLCQVVDSAFLPTRVGFIVPSPALFDMRVQSKKFSSTFSRDFDGINSIVSTCFACSSQEHNLNRQRIWYTRQDTAPGLCWRCVIASNIAVTQCHRLDAQQRHIVSLPEGRRGESLKLWGSDTWATARKWWAFSL